MNLHQRIFSSGTAESTVSIVILTILFFTPLKFGDIELLSPALAHAQSPDSGGGINLGGGANTGLGDIVGALPLGAAGGTGCSVSLLGGASAALGSAAGILGSAVGDIGSTIGNIFGGDNSAADQAFQEAQTLPEGDLPSVLGDNSAAENAFQQAQTLPEGDLPSVLGDSSGLFDAGSSDLSGLVGDFGGSLGSIAGAAGGIIGGGGEVPVSDSKAQKIARSNLNIQASNQMRDNVLSCLARSLARTMLQQMTTSVVNWINSGFNGSPSFVQNYDQFFTNVADQTIGQFIQGSDLAFLCSPFKLQVKIAIARAYGFRNAPSCTLTQITNNIDGFMNRFDQGGWPAFISFTTTPTNNPYGAFMYGQAKLQGAVANAVNQKNLDLNLGSGFLSFQQEQNCQNYGNVEGSAGLIAPPTSPNRSRTSIADGNGVRVCDLVNTTPGKAIQGSLDTTLGTNFRQLEGAKYFDEIIGALVSQLIQNVMNNGLANLSNNGGYQNYGLGNSAYTTNNTALGQSLAQNIANVAQEPKAIAKIDQDNIKAITDTQGILILVSQCWQKVANGTTSKTLTLSPEQIQTAANTVSVLQATSTALNIKLQAYQTILGNMNGIISTLTQLQTQAAATTDPLTLQTLSKNFLGYTTSGKLPTPADLTAVVIDQRQLEKDLFGLQQLGRNSYNQCHALTNP